MALQFRKGTNTERLAITPVVGEPIWTTDTNKLYIGDGVTIGGVELSIDSAFVSGIITQTAFNDIIDSNYVQARQLAQTPQDFAYASLTGTPNILDSADVISLSPPQDFAYASLTGTPNITGIVDSAINALVDGAPAALDTLAELATQLNNDSDAIAAVVNTLALKLNIADVVPQDFAYGSLTGTPTNVSDFANDAGYITAAAATDSAEVTGIINNVVDATYVQARQTPQDFAYASLTGTPYIFDSATIAAITVANSLDSAMIQAIIDGSGVDEAGVIAIVDSNYVASRVTLAYAGNATVKNYKFIADSGDTIFTGADANGLSLSFNDQLVQVYLNGVLLLDTEDYTKSSNNTITLVDPADAGDQLIVANFKSFFSSAGLDSAGITAVIDASYIQANQTSQDFAYGSLTGAPNILDSANVIALQTPQDFAYASLTGTPTNVSDFANDAGYITAAAATDSAEVTGIINNVVDAAYVQALSPLQDFAYASLTGTPNILDSANVIALQTPQDFAYASLTGTPNITGIVDSAINALVDGAPAALDTLAELATALNDDSNAIAAITTALTLKLNIADVVPQDFAYASLTGTPNILDSANVIAIHNALGGVDSAAITSMIDSNYVSSRVTLAFAGSASVHNYKFIADSGDTIFTGADANGTTLGFTDQLVQVYLNGVLLLESEDYTKSGHDTITLVDPADTGDQLIIADFTAFFAGAGLSAEDVTAAVDSAYVQARQTPQDFAYASLTGTPNVLDSANVVNLIDSAYVQARQLAQTPQDFAYASLTGTPNILDSANVSTLITTAVDALVAGAPAALDTLAELATQLNNDSDAIGAVVNTLALKLNIADVVPQDFAYASLTDKPALFDGAYSSLTGTPNILDSANVIALQTPQDFAYGSLTGTPNILDSAAVTSIASAIGGVDSAAIISIIDSNYVASRVTLAYAGNASVTDTKFIADSGQTVFNGLSYNDQFVQVHLNGVLLLNTDDYVKSGNDTITLTQAVAIGDQLVVSDFTSFFTNTTVTAATIHGFIDSALSSTGASDISTFKFIATANQTVFTGSDVNSNTLDIDTSGIQVFLNGILLQQTDDYTATSNTLTLTEAALENSHLIVQSFKRYFNLTGLDSADVIQIITDAGISGSLDSAAVIALQTPQDFAYASLTGSPNITSIVDSAINALVDGAPGALDTLAELATQLNNDSDAIAAIVTNLALKLNIADVVPQDFAFASLTGTPSFFDGNYASLANLPNILDSADVIALSPPQDFAYASLTGTPNILDSADVTAIASALGGVDSATITSMIDSDYVASRVTLAYAGGASVADTKFIADSAQTIFTGLSYNNQFVQVHLNGVLLVDSDDYVKSGNDTITTTYGLNIGDQLVVSDFTSFFTNQTVDSAYITGLMANTASSSLTSYAFVADSGATTFGGMVYSPNNIQVFLNGILLGSADYTATNGTTIVLESGVTQDDEIRVASFNGLYTVDIAGFVDSAYINARVDALPQDFAYASLTGAPNILDSADVIALSPPQDFAFASLTGTPSFFDGNYASLANLPNILDSANVSTLITTAVDALVGGAPAALDTLNELATQLNNDSDAIAAITNTLALKLNIADVIAQDFAYASLTGAPTLFDGAYSSLTGTPTILDSAAVSAIAGAGGGGGGIDSAQLATEITQQLALLDIADIINDDGNPGDALVSTGNGGAEWSDIKATIRQKAIAMALLFRA